LVSGHFSHGLTPYPYYFFESVRLAWNQIVILQNPAPNLMGTTKDADELRSSIELFLEARAGLNDAEKNTAGMRQFSDRAKELLDKIDPTL
jgi:hypothetical protein